MRAIPPNQVDVLSGFLERQWWYGNSQAGIRDAVMMGAGLLGLRWAEVQAIRREDVISEGFLLRVRTAKGGRERTIETGRSWHSGTRIVSSFREGDEPNDLLFKTSSGKAVRYEQILRRCKAWTKKACDQAYTFHCLRHSFAVSMYLAGKDVLEISRALGHKSLQWTSTYLATIVPVASAGAIPFTRDEGSKRTLRIYEPEGGEV